MIQKIDFLEFIARKYDLSHFSRAKPGSLGGALTRSVKSDRGIISEIWGGVIGDYLGGFTTWKIFTVGGSPLQCLSVRVLLKIKFLELKMKRQCRKMSQTWVHPTNMCDWCNWTIKSQQSERKKRRKENNGRWQQVGGHHSKNKVCKRKNDPTPNAKLDLVRCTPFPTQFE